MAMYQFNTRNARVFVYFNLHLKLWSVKALEGPYRGLVIAHCPALTLMEVSPKVSQAGRQRVRREGKKNVHAGLVGRLQAVHPDSKACQEGLTLPFLGTAWAIDVSGAEQVTYNPYKYSTFVVTKEPHLAVVHAEGALLTAATRGVFLWACHVERLDIIEQQPLALHVA